jgi:hypothetical protein
MQESSFITDLRKLSIKMSIGIAADNNCADMAADNNCADMAADNNCVDMI